MKQLISDHHRTDAQARAAVLLDRIKIETRWLLISAPSRGFRLAEEIYPFERALLVKLWPAIRARRIEALEGDFYEVVADRASLLTHLIEIRRQRAHAKANAQ